MGTRNFKQMNASKIYAITAEEQEEFDFLLEDTLYNLSKKMKELAKKKNYSMWDYTEENEWDGDRNYPSRLLQVFDETFEWYGLEIEFQLKTWLNAGYYEGTNLDYTLEILINEGETHINDFSDIDETINYLEKDINEWATEYFGNMKGLALHNFDRLYSKMTNWVEELTDEIEKIYSEVVGIELECIGTF